MPSSRNPIQFRMPVDLYNTLEAEAKVRCLTVNEYARRRLTEAITTKNEFLEHRNLLLRNTIMSRTMIEVMAQLVITQMQYQPESTQEFDELYNSKFVSKVVKLFEKRIEELK